LKTKLLHFLCLTTNVLKELFYTFVVVRNDQLFCYCLCVISFVVVVAEVQECALSCSFN